MIALLLLTAAEIPVAPGGSIAAALKKARPGDTVHVARGEYREHDLVVGAGVRLAGDQARINAQGKGRILTAGNGARIAGFVFEQGVVRGHGGAILCEGTSPEIVNNRFTANGTLTPAGWKPEKIHEDAHDGGAIACRNGCAALIRDNVFTGNFTETGRGAAIAVVKAQPRIENNVFLNNESGRADLMRSSDGGAVSLYDRAHATVTGNRFIGNRALAQNDGGGLFVALWSSPVIEGNTFVDNYASDDGGALFVGGQKHHYGTPLDPFPPAAEFHVRVRRNVMLGNRNASLTGGALRITMESRVEFADNLLGFNTGAQFQRSELQVHHNTILDDVLYSENKEGLKPPRFEANKLRRPIRLEGKPVVEMEDNVEGGALKLEPVELLASAVEYRADLHQTVYRVPSSDTALAGRVVVAGDRWSVAARHGDGELAVWGNLGQGRVLRVIPEFK